MPLLLACRWSVLSVSFPVIYFLFFLFALHTYLHVDFFLNAFSTAILKWWFFPVYLYRRVPVFLATNDVMYPQGVQIFMTNGLETRDWSMAKLRWVKTQRHTSWSVLTGAELRFRSDTQNSLSPHMVPWSCFDILQQTRRKCVVEDPNNRWTYIEPCLSLDCR